LAKTPEYDGTTYRGLSFPFAEEANNYVSSFSVGKNVDFKAYTSTSKTTKDFSYTDFTGDRNVQIEFRSSKGRDLTGDNGGHAFNKVEQEVLFDRNTQMRVVSKTRTSAGNWKIIVTDP
jgi:hypothetical protein